MLDENDPNNALAKNGACCADAGTLLDARRHLDRPVRVATLRAVRRRCGAHPRLLRLALTGE